MGAVAGPIGAAAGAVVGAIAGGLAGHAAGEAVNPRSAVIPSSMKSARAWAPQVARSPVRPSAALRARSERPRAQSSAALREDSPARAQPK
jgi:phage tail tape-measure protein